MNDEKDKITGRDDEGLSKREKKKKRKEDTKDIERKVKMNQMKKKVKTTIKNQHYQVINL